MRTEQPRETGCTRTQPASDATRLPRLGKTADEKGMGVTGLPRLAKAVDLTGVRGLRQSE